MAVPSVPVLPGSAVPSRRRRRVVYMPADSFPDKPDVDLADIAGQSATNDPSPARVSVGLSRACRHAAALAQQLAFVPASLFRRRCAQEVLLDQLGQLMKQSLGPPAPPTRHSTVPSVLEQRTLQLMDIATPRTPYDSAHGPLWTIA